ncbi:hypothetical protein J437_LFUL006962 [Ladona fulva]|uniref:Uncharacterized protein n=1 Tax=Ladona fulva TaxID=123851 RepID=A0A8K0P2L7_LADFU|nr:hypothetical protein J437_LFUL006962 [Ladona fulva]
MDLRMKHPFCALIAGPSSCGKTFLVSRLLTHKAHMFDVNFQSTVWCYSECQTFYDTLKDVKFVEGLPNVNDFPHWDSPTLIIIDDLMREADGRVVDLFTRGSHHRSLKSYNDATAKPHGYLFIDLKQSTPDIYRYHAEIFPDDYFNYFYVPKK